MVHSKSFRRALRATSLLALLGYSVPGNASTEEGATKKALLIDDFSSGVSALGTQWEGFTDRVMGGKSTMSSGREFADGMPVMAMRGDVSLKNNGGFIQVRLMLNPEERAFDASRFTGLSLKVKGTGDSYYVFLRTTANRLPWSFFKAPLPVSRAWTEVFLPWSAFQKGDFGSLFGFDPRKIVSLAVVAYKKEFTADLYVAEVNFY